MCWYCIDGPPSWVDVELFINTGAVDNEGDAAKALTMYYWASACNDSKNDLGPVFRSYGMNWRDHGP